MSNVIEKKTTQNIEQRAFHINNDIEHIRQLNQNDCGPTCLKMAVKFINRSLPDPLKNEKVSKIDQILKHLSLDSKSLWTIDIAHVCAIEKINHVMYTITLGVQDSYSSVDFYSNDTNFKLEMLRIEEKFSNSNNLGINVIKQSIELDKIKYELNMNNVCIVLVDANLLNGKNIHLKDEDLGVVLESDEIKSYFHTSKASCFFNPFRKQNEKSDLNKMVELNIKKSLRSNFLGHYIILIGYDDTKELIFYRNPSSSLNFSFTSYLNFEIARKSFGTDQDILFVYQNF